MKLSLKCEKDIEKILSLKDFSDIYKEANKVCVENKGKDVYIRAIVEFSNYCRRNCKYCGLNCSNKNVKRYRMSPDEIVDVSIKAHKVGYKTIVMQSGEDKWFTSKILGEIVKEVKKTGIKITLSCGEMTYDELAYLKECGADRYLLKHETADENIYEFLHPGYRLKERVECLKNIKSLGYETGSGFMIGLPNQNIKTIAKDIMLLKQIGCDMAGIGPFIPHPETPLKNESKGNTELCKRAVALTRILLPNINLPGTTSLGVVNESEKDNVFSCGANVIMRKVTPSEYKKFYEIYPSNLGETDIKKDRENLEEYIRKIGKNPL